MDIPEICCHIVSFLDSDLSKKSKTIKELIAEELGIEQITEEEFEKYMKSPKGWTFNMVDNLMAVAPALLEHVRNIANLRLVNKFFHELLNPFVIAHNLKICNYDTTCLITCSNIIINFPNNITWFKAFLNTIDFKRLGIHMLLYKIMFNNNLQYLTEILNINPPKEIIDKAIMNGAKRLERYEVIELINKHYGET